MSLRRKISQSGLEVERPRMLILADDLSESILKVVYFRSSASVSLLRLWAILSWFSFSRRS
jgi:hypothetical protein